MNRLDLIEPPNLSGFTPFQKFNRCPMIGRARIRIADVDGEEFKEALFRPLPCPHNQRRQLDPLPPASSLIAEEKSSSFFDRPSSLRLPVTSFSPWSGLTRHIMASESLGFPMCSAQFR